MTNYPPIILPAPTNPAWNRAKEIAVALQNRKKHNPFRVAALVDAFAESWWMPTAVGDSGQSFGPWQMKKIFYWKPIFDGIEVDICDPKTTLTQHVDALIFALSLPANKAVSDALDAATTGENATRLFAGGFERASAGGAIERRVALAPPIEVWLAHLAPRHLHSADSSSMVGRVGNYGCLGSGWRNRTIFRRDVLHEQIRFLKFEFPMMAHSSRA